MKDPEVRKLIAVDDTLLDDLKNALVSATNEIAKSRQREQSLALEVDRHKPITEEEAAAYLKRDKESLRNYRTLGLDSFKKGGSRWYTKGIIDDWLATGRVIQHKR